MNKIVNCINCNSKEFKPFANVPDRHYGIKGNFTLDKCKNCGLVFLNPMPTEKELTAFYPQESYYSYHIDIFKKNPIKDFFKKLFLMDNSVKEPKFNKPGKILDIGCGNGWVLYQFKLKGWEVYGVEPSKIGSEIGNKAGLNIFNGELLSASFDNLKFDYVRSNHSFEHIHNPNEIINEIHRILKSNGKLLIGIPNINGINAKIFNKYWYYLGAPVHTFNYCEKTITEILNKNGFKIEKINYNSNWSGVLGSIQIYLNRKNQKISHDGFLVNFMPLRFLFNVIAKTQNLFKVGDCIEIIAVKK
jgi:SAM-dependent methyltransferase